MIQILRPITSETMKRSSCFILILVLLCAAVAFLGWAFNSIPAQAQIAFGPASPDLAFSQKILLSWHLLQNEDHLTLPADPFGTEIPFQINLGESPISVANRLEAAGVIQNATDFRNFLVYAGLDTSIQAGDYTLNPATPAIEIAYTLLDATPSNVPFAILAGWRVEEIAASLPNSGLEVPADIFLNEALDQGLEGYLLPGVYTISRAITTRSLLNTLTTAFSNAITPELKAGFEKQGLSVEEAVRLASIVEREAIVDREKPLIASVFLNRLAINMKLEADPTVQYALGYNQAQDTWWTNPLTTENLKTDSPYNTYLYPGLPPGAICNPDLESLKAVAFPAQTPYYYFRATCDNDGLHNFAETFEEHVGNQCP